MSKPKRDESIKLDPPELAALKEKAKREGGVAVDLSEVARELANCGVPPLPLALVTGLLAHNRKLRMVKDEACGESTLAYKMAFKFLLDTRMLATRKAMEVLFDDYLKGQQDGDEDEGGDKKDETPILH